MAPPVADSTKMDEKKHSPRRINKPLIEKRRRARINDCLAQLKAIVLEATDTQSPRPSKLEKADILEMTVDFIKRNSKPAEVKPENKDGETNTADYMQGYTGCLAEITQFLEKTRQVNTALKTDIIAHVSNKMKDKCGNKPKQCKVPLNKIETAEPTGRLPLEQKTELKPSNESSPTKPAQTLDSSSHKQSVQAESASIQPRPVAAQNPPATPVGLYCGGQVLLLLQLPATQPLVTSQPLVTPTCNVLPATSSSLPVLSATAVPPNNLGGIPNYIRELNLAGPANFPLISLAANGSSVLTGATPSKAPGVSSLQQPHQTGNQTAAVNLSIKQPVSQSNAPPTGNDVNQSDSPWRPW